MVPMPSPHDYGQDGHEGLVMFQSLKKNDVSITILFAEFIQRFQPAVKHTVAQRFRSNKDFEMNMGYTNYVMEEGAKVPRLFPSDLDQNEDGIFQFGKSFFAW